MRAGILRSGTPGVRLGRALMLSLALHALLFLPLPGMEPRKREPVLSVKLLPIPDTRPDLESSRTEEPPVSPVFRPPASQPASLASPEAPRPLTGKALQTALGKLSREMFYPREAVERGLEGRVVLLLSLAENGTVRSVEIAAGSGHSVLDEAALHAAGRLRQVQGGHRQVLLPVEFRLE